MAKAPVNPYLSPTDFKVGLAAVDPKFGPAIDDLVRAAASGAVETSTVVEVLHRMMASLNANKHLAVSYRRLAAGAESVEHLDAALALFDEAVEAQKLDPRGALVPCRNPENALEQARKA
jgi:hypothetical protein